MISTIVAQKPVHMGFIWQIYVFPLQYHPTMCINILLYIFVVVFADGRQLRSFNGCKSWQMYWAINWFINILQQMIRMIFARKASLRVFCSKCLYTCQILEQSYFLAWWKVETWLHSLWNWLCDWFSLNDVVFKSWLDHLLIKMWCDHFWEYVSKMFSVLLLWNGMSEAHIPHSFTFEPSNLVSPSFRSSLFLLVSLFFTLIYLPFWFNHSFFFFNIISVPNFLLHALTTRFGKYLTALSNINGGAFTIIFHNFQSVGFALNFRDDIILMKDILEWIRQWNSSSVAEFA